MTHTERLIEESRERARARANVLQSELGQRLHELNQPQFARLKLGLDKLKTQHINLLDQAVVNRIISPDDYRRFMGEYMDRISLADLLTAL